MSLSTEKLVLIRLIQAIPRYVSGASIAKSLDISRAAVWKAIRALRQNGYIIEAATNKGYRLIKEPDMLSPEGIKIYLPDEYKALKIVVRQSAVSTNDEAKMLAIKGAAHGTAVLAETQSGGRGRYSRAFHSPAGTGLYMSAVLRPKISLSDTPIVTIAAAVAVCRSIRKLTGLLPAVKWVNDIYLGGKKICGILTEAALDAESGEITGVVAGIGINVSTKTGEFPAELRDSAGSIYPDGNALVSRNAFAAHILGELLGLCEGQRIADRDFMREYRELLFMLGKDVTFTRGAEQDTGVALDVDADGRLLVKRRADGEILALNSGEIVTVRTL